MQYSRHCRDLEDSESAAWLLRLYRASARGMLSWLLRSGMACWRLRVRDRESMNIEINYQLRLSVEEMKTLEHFWNEPIDDLVKSMAQAAGYRCIQQYIDLYAERLREGENGRPRQDQI
jgi:hypothetical protein